MDIEIIRTEVIQIIRYMVPDHHEYRDSTHEINLPESGFKIHNHLLTTPQTPSFSSNRSLTSLGSVMLPVYPFVFS